jgi:hypothetical protein
LVPGLANSSIQKYAHTSPALANTALGGCWAVVVSFRFHARRVDSDPPQAAVCAPILSGGIEAVAQAREKAAGNAGFGTARALTPPWVSSIMCVRVLKEAV